MQITIRYRKGSCSSEAKNLERWIMQEDASDQNAQEKFIIFSRQNSRKLCNSSKQNCVVPVLLYLLQRRWVSPRASGILALHNERFCLERVGFWLDLDLKSVDVSRTERATMNFILTVSIRAIVELENAQEPFSKCLPNENSDVKKDDRCSSLALNHHCVVWCMNIIKIHAWAELYPVTLSFGFLSWSLP